MSYIELLERRRLLSAALISVTPDGLSAGGSASQVSAVSRDGHYVVFTSSATDLIAGTTDTNGADDVFVRDRFSGTTSLVSATPTGTAAGNGSSYNASVTPDGRYVTFLSNATNLVPGVSDNNNAVDVFVRDLVTGTTTLVSVAATGGATADGDSSTGLRLSISDNGRYVAFSSTALNLVANISDLNGSPDVYVRDRTAGTTALVSINTSGTGAANAGSTDSILTPDGAFVVFTSDATNVTAITGGPANIYRRNLSTGSTEMVSVDTTGTAPGGGAGGASISADGRYVAFSSDSSDLVTLDANGREDVFVRDTTNRVTTLVSVATTLGGADGVSFGPSISADSSRIAFLSTSTNLVDGVIDNNGVQDVFIRDLGDSTTRVVSATVDGTSTGNSSLGSTQATLSRDGRFVAFRSDATNLVAGATDANAVNDVFLRDLSTDTTILLSLTEDGQASGNFSSGGPILSADGGTVVFDSAATTLATVTDENNANDAFVWSFAQLVGQTLDVGGTEAGDAISVTSAGAVTTVARGTQSAIFRTDAITGVRVDGGAGDDSIFSADFASTLLGGAGNDVLSSGNFFDSLLGGDGNDTMFGFLGADSLFGGAGNDVMSGGKGFDSIEGNGGNDSIVGGLGNDTIRGGSDNDTLDGSDGNDSIFGGAGFDVLTGSTGNDSLYGGDQGDTMGGGQGNDLLVGGKGFDVLTGGVGNDILQGDEGNDTLNAQDGLADSVDGGSGVNTGVVDAGLDSVSNVTP